MSGSKLSLNEVGLIIREARLRAGLTQLELSAMLGYDSMQFVSLFERGLSKCPLKVLGKCCALLKIPPASLIKKVQTYESLYIEEAIMEGYKATEPVTRKKGIPSAGTKSKRKGSVSVSESRGNA